MKKVAVVTGAYQGIGRGIADGLKNAGYLRRLFPKRRSVVALLGKTVPLSVAIVIASHIHILLLSYYVHYVCKAHNSIDGLGALARKIGLQGA